MIIAVALAACGVQPRDESPCSTVALAYCDATYACDANYAYHALCASRAATWCASADLPASLDQGTANACADLWWQASCGSDATIQISPSMVSCAEQFWPCLDDTSPVCAPKKARTP